jgi:hypothetical protein
MTTRATIKAKVLRIINKTAGYAGFHTDDHVNDVIQDAIDHIVSQSFMAGEGWFKVIGLVAMPAAGNTAALPTGCAIIEDIRYLVNDTYVPILIRDGDGMPQQAATGTTTSFPGYVRIVGTDMYFDPPPTETGADRIQIEYYAYPAELANDASVISAQLDRSMERYLTWRAASQLMAMAGKPNREWERYENEWAFNVQQILSKRVRQRTYIGEFDG